MAQLSIDDASMAQVVEALQSAGITFTISNGEPVQPATQLHDHIVAVHGQEELAAVARKVEELIEQLLQTVAVATERMPSIEPHDLTRLDDIADRLRTSTSHHNMSVLEMVANALAGATHYETLSRLEQISNGMAAGAAVARGY